MLYVPVNNYGHVGMLFELMLYVPVDNYGHVGMLFELMLYVPVDNYGHVGMLPPLNGNFYVMTFRKCLRYNHPTKPRGPIYMDGLTLTTFLVRLRPEWLTSNQMVSLYCICFAWWHKQRIYFFRPQWVNILTAYGLPIFGDNTSVTLNNQI